MEDVIEALAEVKITGRISKARNKQQEAVIEVKKKL